MLDILYIFAFLNFSWKSAIWISRYEIELLITEKSFYIKNIKNGLMILGNMQFFIYDMKSLIKTNKNIYKVWKK